MSHYIDRAVRYPPLHHLMEWPTEGKDDRARTMENSNEFAEARQTMAKHLRDDKGLRLGYEANIAMLLHDRYGITEHKKRNAAAQDILRLVFES